MEWPWGGGVDIKWDDPFSVQTVSVAVSSEGIRRMPVIECPKEERLRDKPKECLRGRLWRTPPAALFEIIISLPALLLFLLFHILSSNSICKISKPTLRA